MKTIKRSIALLMTLVLMATVALVPASAAEQKDYSKYKVYTALGDSVPTGYGALNGNVSTGYERISGSYPDLLAKDLNMKLNMKAVCAERSEEIRYLLDDDYEGDAYTGKWVDSSQTLSEADRASCQEAVKEADVITLAVGSNDIFTIPLYACSNRMTEYDAAYTEEMAGKVESLIANNEISEALNTYLYYCGELGVATYAIEQLVNDVLGGFEKYKENLDAITDKIYEMNPDVTLVVMSTINPMYHTPLVDGGAEIGRLWSAYFLCLDNYMQNGCKNRDKYIYVDTRDVSSPMKNYSSFLDQKQSTEPHDDLNHPDAEGHREIADAIEAALPETQFIDIEDAANYDAIVALYNKGVMIGDGGVFFQPNEAVTYKMLAYALYRLDGHANATSWTKVKNYAVDNRKLNLPSDDGFDWNSTVSEDMLESVLDSYASYHGEKNTYQSSGNDTVTRDTLAGILNQLS